MFQLFQMPSQSKVVGQVWASGGPGDRSMSSNPALRKALVQPGPHLFGEMWGCTVLVDGDYVDLWEMAIVGPQEPLRTLILTING